LCLEGLEKRYSKPTSKAYERLNYELGIIREMGYAGYFLIVWDLFVLPEVREYM